MFIHVSILGSEWIICDRKADEEPKFKDECVDGFCDFSVKEIVLRPDDDYGDFKNIEVYKLQCIRHELIHAFMYESGLSYNYQHATQWGHDETVVDWMAIQMPKIMNTYDYVLEKLASEEKDVQ